jgi:hypothetical protein
VELYGGACFEDVVRSGGGWFCAFSTASPDVHRQMKGAHGVRAFAASCAKTVDCGSYERSFASGRPGALVFAFQEHREGSAKDSLCSQIGVRFAGAETRNPATLLAQRWNGVWNAPSQNDFVC